MKGKTISKFLTENLIVANELDKECCMEIANLMNNQHPNPDNITEFISTLDDEDERVDQLTQLAIAGREMRDTTGFSYSRFMKYYNRTKGGQTQ